MWTVPTTTREVVIRSAKSKQSNVTRHVALITHRRFASKSVEPSDTDVPVKGLYRLLQTTTVKNFVPLPAETTTHTIVNREKRNVPPKQYKHQQLKNHKIKHQQRQDNKNNEQEKVQRMSTDPQFFESIMRSSVENKQYNKAAELWNIWESKNIPPTFIMFALAMKTFFCLNNPERVLKIFEAASQTPDIILTTPMFNAIISIYGKQKNQKLCEDYFQRMLRDGLEPNRETFNVMIDMYGKLGNVENAEIFFEHMRSFGITPDTVTYTSLLSVYNKYGLLKKAEALYEEMVSKDIILNDFTVNAMINVFGKLAVKYPSKGYSEKAKILLTRVPFLCLVCYNSMLDMWVKLRNFEEAEKLMTEMHRLGVKPDEYTMSTLIKMYGMSKNADKADEVFEEMEELGIPQNTIIYTSLIKAHVESGNSDRAEELFDQMIRKGLQPTEVTFTTLIDMYGKQRKTRKVKIMFQSMLDLGLVPNTVTFTTIIDMYAKLGDLDMAKTIFKKMEQYGAKPNAWAYNILLDAYNRLQNDVVLGHDLFMHMRREQVTPTAFTYTSMISLYARNLKVGRAEEVFREMVTKGLNLNFTIYNAMTGMYTKVAEVTKEKRNNSDIKQNLRTFWLNNAAEAKN